MRIQRQMEDIVGQVMIDDEMQGIYTGLLLFHHPCKIEISIVIYMHKAFYWLSVILSVFSLLMESHS